MVTSEQQLYQTIVQFDKRIVLHRKLATGSIHDNLFLLLPPNGYSILSTENYIIYLKHIYSFMNTSFIAYFYVATNNNKR